MRHYGDEYPRHGHRNPCEIAEEEILAALRDEPYSMTADAWQSRFQVSGSTGPSALRSNDPQTRPAEKSVAAQGKRG